MLGLGGQAGATWGQEPKAWELMVGAGVGGGPKTPPPFGSPPIPAIGGPIFWTQCLPELFPGKPTASGTW